MTQIEPFQAQSALSASVDQDPRMSSGRLSRCIVAIWIFEIELIGLGTFVDPEELDD